MTSRLGTIGALTCSLALAACVNGPDWGNRYGPDPVLVSDDVERYSKHQHDILTKLAAGSSTPKGLSPDYYGPVFYYEVVQTGFNYVDEKCDRYLRSLFIMDRRRDRVRGGIFLLDKNGSALLRAADVSAEAILVVAQAFGLVEGFTNLFADSYLYSVEPSILFSTVDKLRHEYREQTAIDDNDITTAPAAFERIRGYLALCMPQTIEAKINEKIAGAPAVTDKPGKAPGEQPKEAPKAAPEKETGSSVAPRVMLQ